MKVANRLRSSAVAAVVLLGGVANGAALPLTLLPGEAGFNTPLAQYTNVGHTQISGGVLEATGFTATFSFTTTANSLGIAATNLFGAFVNETLTLIDTSTSPHMDLVGPTPVVGSFSHFLTLTPAEQTDTFEYELTASSVTTSIPGLTQGFATGTVTALSTVPLPSALLMFGSVLLGGSGLFLRRRKVAMPSA